MLVVMLLVVVLEVGIGRVWECVDVVRVVEDDVVLGRYCVLE